MNVVTFFTKPDCSLCSAALYVVKRVQTAIPFELQFVDISDESQKQWFEAYKNDIPVVHVNGVEISRHRVSERELRRHLADVS